MKKNAKFIRVSELNGFNCSIFEDESGDSYIYSGQFRGRQKGESASIEVDEFNRISSVQFKCCEFSVVKA